MRSKGDSHLLPRLDQKCLCFMDLYKCGRQRARGEIIYIERERRRRCERERYPEGHKTSWFASSFVELIITFSFEEQVLRGIETLFF